MTHSLIAKRLRAFAAVALLGLVACGDPHPELPLRPTPHRGFSEPRFASSAAIAESLSAALTTASPAISVAAAVGDSIVWSAAFGPSDLETATPATPEHRFRIYSLSKGMTATMALALRDRGALDLDAPVSRYVPAFPARDGVTPRRLLGHIGGIRHYRDDEAIGTRSCPRPADAVEIFAADSLESAPGSTYLYSSWGYALLSAALESAGGAPFDSLLERAVLRPAGMTATGIPSGPALLTGEVTPYEPTRRSVRRARTVDNRCKWGGGALVATAVDVARFGAALLGGKLLPRASVDEMFTSMTTADGASTDYGMGFGVATDSTGLRRVAHSGSAMGGRSAIVMLPDRRVVVVILSNVEGDRLTPTALAIAKAFAAASP